MQLHWIDLGIIVLYLIAIAEQVAMLAVYGDIPPDTRSILWLRRPPLGGGRI